MILKTLKHYWIIASVGAALQVVFLVLDNERGALSSFAGTALAALIQYWAVAVTRAILQKKSVAIASTLIVLKYAIFGIILMFFGSGFKLHPLGFFVSCPICSSNHTNFTAMGIFVKGKYIALI